jgi:hypothetical protein
MASAAAQCCSWAHPISRVQCESCFAVVVDLSSVDGLLNCTCTYHRARTRAAIRCGACYHNSRPCQLQAIERLHRFPRCVHISELHSCHAEISARRILLDLDLLNLPEW